MTNSEQHTAGKTAQRAQDLVNLLDHLAWTDTVKPELDKLKVYYSNLLVQTTLGLPISLNGKEVTPAQLAGRVEGIDFISKLFESILARGVDAIKRLEDNNK